MTDRLYVNEEDKIFYGGVSKWSSLAQTNIAGGSPNAPSITTVTWNVNPVAQNSEPLVSLSNGVFTFLKSGVYSIHACPSVKNHNSSNPDRFGSDLVLMRPGASDISVIRQTSLGPVDTSSPLLTVRYIHPLCGVFHILKGQGVRVVIYNQSTETMDITTDGIITIQRLL